VGHGMGLARPMPWVSGVVAVGLWPTGGGSQVSWLWVVVGLQPSDGWLRGS
jgi:hypothetical protein